MKVKNAKFTKIKKPLTDKEKGEKKRRIKHIFKIVLDIIVYAFAGFMLIGLVLGSTQKVKKAYASFYSDNYTSIKDIPTDRDYDLCLYYYYDVNYKKTFPDYFTFAGSGLISSYSYFTTLNISPVFNNNGTEYNTISLLYTQTSQTFTLRLGSSISLISVTTSDMTIHRSDLLVRLFSGQYSVYLSDNPDTNNIRFYRWLVYYLSNKGFSRVSESLYYNPISYNYLLSNSSNPDNIRSGGYLFRNDAIYSDFPNDADASHPIVMFSGSFRCNGVLYKGIRFNIATVYGNHLNPHTQQYDPYYYYDFNIRSGGANINNNQAIANSNDDFWKGWYYLASIQYIAYDDTLTTVWDTRTLYESGQINVQLLGGWVGDSESSVSPYRDLYIYYSMDYQNNTSIFDYFTQLTSLSYAQYITIIGDGYINAIPGGTPDTYTGNFTTVFGWFSTALGGLLPLLSFSLIPGITISTLIMIPITVTLILFVIKLFKR